MSVKYYKSNAPENLILFAVSMVSDFVIPGKIYRFLSNFSDVMSYIQGASKQKLYRINLILLLATLSL